MFVQREQIQTLNRSVALLEEMTGHVTNKGVQKIKACSIQDQILFPHLF